MRYDYLIVGAGPFGAAFARAATDRGHKCLVIDRREQVAGNAFSRCIEGINVHMYGAHIFHTGNDTIWNFVQRFGRWQPFHLSPRARIGDRMYSFPINLLTLHQLWGVCTPEEARRKLAEVQIPSNNPQNAEQWLLSQVGQEIYELFFRGYTKKQWFKEPRELPASIVQRLPIRLTYNDNYFDVRYQAIPVGGYTRIFQNMLDGIPVELETDFFRLDWRRYARRLVYTGPIDRFFRYEAGRLEYRSLRFETKIVDGDFQGHAVVNYPEESVPYLRSVEHKHFEEPGPKHLGNRRSAKSVVTFDYPIHPSAQDPAEDPQYPVRDEANSLRYSKYAELARQCSDMLFGGRLGEYRYYDMDQAIASALAKARRFDARRATKLNWQPSHGFADISGRRIATGADISDRLHVYAVAHNAARLAMIPGASYISKLRLDQLAIAEELRGEQLAEGRAFLCETLDFAGKEYCGFVNARWNEKYAQNMGRNFQAPRTVRLEEFYTLAEQLEPSTVLVPELAGNAHGPTGWATLADRNFPGMSKYLVELEGIGILSMDGNAASVWNNNFICHNEVMEDFLTTWREAFWYLYERYGFNIEFGCPPSERHRKWGYLAEHITLMYFSNRPDLRIARVPGRNVQRLRAPIRGPNGMARILVTG
jgi:UDP-galactopyranose mutase